MAICLIRVGFSDERDIGYLPVSLLSLGAALEKRKFKVKIVDFEPLVRQDKMALDKNFHAKAANIIMRENINILGFTTRCDTYPSVLNVARRCKEINPSCTIIFGGPQATILDKETLGEFKFVDIIVRGEGELTIVELMRRLKDKKGLNNINGITYRGSDGRVIRNPDRALIKNLDSLPPLAYHLLDGYENGKKVNSFDKKWTTIEAGRGCPYNCVFCSTSLVLKRTYRMKSPERIVKEIETLKKKYGVMYFFFLHDHLLFDKKIIAEICNLLIEKNLDIYWNCSSRPDDISPELLKSMVQSGCFGIYLGVESGSQRIQRLIKKNIDVSKVLNIVRKCEKYNLLIGLSFIIGFPDERLEDINATLKLALGCSLSRKIFIQLHLLSPMPKTPLCEDCKDRLIFTGIFSDVAEGPAVKFQENLDLIKKYPSIFSVFYSIKPKHFSLSFFYNIANVFLEILLIYRVSCHIIMKEFKFTPLGLFEKLYASTDKKGKKDFVLTREQVGKIFSDFAVGLYEPKSAAATFMKSILRIEVKKYQRVKSQPFGF